MPRIFIRCFPPRPHFVGRRAFLLTTPQYKGMRQANNRHPQQQQQQHAALCLFLFGSTSVPHAFSTHGSSASLVVGFHPPMSNFASVHCEAEVQVSVLRALPIDVSFSPFSELSAQCFHHRPLATRTRCCLWCFFVTIFMIAGQLSRGSGSSLPRDHRSVWEGRQ